MAPPARGGRPRHVPVRTCVACRQTDTKRTLVRLVRGPDAGVTIDPTGKRSGRGAYLCESAACWQAAISRGTISRALKLDSIPEADLQTIRAFAQRLSGASDPVANPPSID